jgi:hypothetical protein
MISTYREGFIRGFRVNLPILRNRNLLDIGVADDKGPCGFGVQFSNDGCLINIDCCFMVIWIRLLGIRETCDAQ